MSTLAEMKAVEACEQLRRSERGTAALKGLQKFLDASAWSLDYSNQAAVMTLIKEAFAGSYGTVLAVIEDNLPKTRRGGSDGRD